MSASPLRRSDTGELPRSRARDAAPARSPRRSSGPARGRTAIPTSTRTAKPTGGGRVSSQRRQRERHFRRRRRDLLEDVALGLLVTIILTAMTAGLGALALIEVPLAVLLVGSVVAERMIRRRRPGAGGRRPSRRSRGRR